MVSLSLFSPHPASAKNSPFHGRLKKTCGVRGKRCLNSSQPKQKQPPKGIPFHLNEQEIDPSEKEKKISQWVVNRSCSLWERDKWACFPKCLQELGRFLGSLALALRVHSPMQACLAWQWSWGMGSGKQVPLSSLLRPTVWPRRESIWVSLIEVPGLV